jgi:hypothetical protein
MKLRRWAGHVACMTEKINVYRNLNRGILERNNLEDPGIDKRIMLKCI